MLRLSREALCAALVVSASVSSPGWVAAQSAPGPVQSEEAPEDSAPVAPSPSDQAESVSEEEEAEQEEEDSLSDVDETVIEYGDSDDKDKVDGTRVQDLPTPVVTGSVANIQDPNKLEPGADKSTGVQGRVASRSTRKVLPDAPVTAKGNTDGKVRSTITDRSGRYRLYLPPGQYTLRSFYDLYHGARWDNVQVTRGQFKRINFVLDPISEEDAGVQEQEVPYLADTSSEAAQLNIRKEAVTVQDAISAEEISRSGDGTAKGAAARVVGVTIDDDGRIIVRGLAGSYNRILLNDIPVPSVDPDVPAVKLDRFPSDIVSNLGVVKVPRPDLPGNFAGGLVRIQTENYPRELELKGGIGLGANSMSTFQDMPTYQGSKTDWLGYDNGVRALPSAVGNQKLEPARRGEDGYTSAEVAEISKSFPDIWNPKQRLAMPKMGMNFTVGDTVELGKKKKELGYRINFLYEYEDKIYDGFNRRYRFNPDQTVRSERQNFDYLQGTQEVLWGAFGSGYLAANQDNSIFATTFFSRTSDDTTLLQLGQEDENAIPKTKDSYNFIGRTLFWNQLRGDHRNLGDTRLQLNWNAVATVGRRDEPDRRQIQQQLGSQFISEASRFYSDLQQLDFAGTSSLRFPIWEGAYGTVGVDAAYETRDFAARRFIAQQYQDKPLVGDPEVVLGPDGLGVISTMRELTRATDSYDASSNLYGTFAQLETPITDWLKFLGLMRFEVFQQQVISKDQFTGETDPADQTNRTDLDPMPSANFAFQINDKMFVKLGYGMTVIRPTFRQLAPFLYTDFLRGWNIVGNPDLDRARIQNAEARYEYYFGATDLLAATFFYKNFKDAIEFSVTSSLNAQATFENADRSWLYGGELELRLGFDRFHDKLSDFFFYGNVALIQSQTTLSEDSLAAVKQRDMFLQSPYVTNLSLRFDDDDSGVMVGLVYNSFGPRLVEVIGAEGFQKDPDVYEKSQHLLDLVSSWEVNEHVQLGLKWKNIAFAKKRYKQGEELVLLQNRGTTVSVGASFSY